MTAAPRPIVEVKNVTRSYGDLVALDDVSVDIPAGKITGRVVADRGGIPPLDGMRVVASWTDGTIDLDPLAIDQADVGPDGSFTIDGLFGARAIRLSGVSAGWQVAAIRHGRTDITTSMVEIDHGSTLEVVITLTRR